MPKKLQRFCNFAVFSRSQPLRTLLRPQTETAVFPLRKRRTTRLNLKYPRPEQNTQRISRGKATVLGQGGAESGAVGDENGFLNVPDDPRLLGLIDAWPMLSEVTREAIAKLADDDSHDVDDVTVGAAEKAVSR